MWNRLWDRLARWCLESRGDLDARGLLIPGSAVEWRYLTKGDPIVAVFNSTGGFHDIKRIPPKDKESSV